MTERRRLAITRKKSLDGIAEGWNDQCHIVYQCASVGDIQELTKLNTEGLDDQKSIDQMQKLCEQHFVSGKGMFLDESNNLVLQDMHASDIRDLPPTVWQELFAEIAGVTLDPKATAKDQPAVALPQNDEPPSETPSSTG